MKLYIKYMVSTRCKMTVQAALNELGIQGGLIELGEVEISGDITNNQHNLLRISLLKSGLELIDDRRAILVEKIKNVIINMVHYADELPKTKNSNYISEKLNYDYTYLSNIFSEATGTTIERYVIAHKIERAKELILYDEINLTQIAYKLNYSSVAHLSTQFKKVTGLTPSFFKQLTQKQRTALDNV